MTPSTFLLLLKVAIQCDGKKTFDLFCLLNINNKAGNLLSFRSLTGQVVY